MVPGDLRVLGAMGKLADPVRWSAHGLLSLLLVFAEFSGFSHWDFWLEGGLRMPRPVCLVFVRNVCVCVLHLVASLFS